MMSLEEELLDSCSTHSQSEESLTRCPVSASQKLVQVKKEPKLITVHSDPMVIETKMYRPANAQQVITHSNLSR